MVRIYDCFTTRAFGDSSLVFVTDYHPASRNLLEHHFPSHSSAASLHLRSRQSSSLVPEPTIWSYLVQLTSALKTIHASGLAARLVSPSKILVTGKNRIRLNSCAVLDVVQSNAASTSTNDLPALSELHLDDLRQLGLLALALATSNPNAATNAAKAFQSLSRTYSDRLKTAIVSLLDAGSTTSPNAVQDVGSFAASISDQAFHTLDASLSSEDAMTSEFGRELENARLVRLLAKLNCILERPEYSPQPGSGGNAWSETGERYFLKLFRDYVFHQVNEDGRPVLDLAHIIACLNKLDAGCEEKICLVSRDEANVLVVSYREVKRGLEGAFGELMRGGSVAATTGGAALGGLGAGTGMRRV